MISRIASQWMRVVLFGIAMAHVGCGSSIVQKTEATAERATRLLALADPGTLRSRFPKVRPYEIVAATALDGCGLADRAAYMAELATMAGAEGPSVEPVNMFALPPLVRYLYRFGHCLTEAQKSSLLAGLTKRQRLTGHGTINQAAMRVTSWYLLAQYFPQAAWTDWDGTRYSSAALRARLVPLIAARVRGMYRDGHGEWLSPTYAMINVLSMLNLVDLAADESVRELADNELTLQIALLRLHSFRGTLVAPITRRNVDQRNGFEQPANYMPAVAQHVLWYYFGEPRLTSDYELRSRTEPFYAGMLALSTWRPPRALYSLTPEHMPIEARVTTPTFSIWGAPYKPMRDVELKGDAYIDSEFAVGTGTVTFDPAWYNDHVQTFAVLLMSDHANNEISCYHPYFRSNLGEDAWSSDRWSPFQQMHRYDGSSVVMLFDIPAGDPWVYGSDNRFTATRSQRKDALFQFFQCRIPRSFDETVFDGNDWIFVRHGGMYVAIATLKGRNEIASPFTPGSTAYQVFKVREPRSALFFRVEKADGRSFEQFRAEVRKRLPAYDAERSAVAFTDQHGVATRVVFSLEREAGTEHRVSTRPKVYRDGRLQAQPATTRVVDSPYLKLEGGVLTVDTPAGSIRIDHSGPRP